MRCAMMKNNINNFSFLIRLFISAFFIFNSGYGQKYSYTDELIKQNKIRSVTLVECNHMYDTLKKDTITGYKLYDKAGNIIQYKYDIGTKIKRIYKYDEKNRVASYLELCARPVMYNKDAEKLTDEMYVDTFSIALFEYNNKNQVVKCSKPINWWDSPMGSSEIKYVYNKKNQLISEIEIAGSGYVINSSLYKYDWNNKLSFELNSHMEMSNEAHHYYHKDSAIDGVYIPTDSLFKSVRRFYGGGGETVYIYDSTGHTILECTSVDCNQKTYQKVVYEYNSMGLLTRIKTYETDQKGNKTKLFLMSEFIYKKE